MKKSKVNFEPESHTYTIDGLPLTGVTTILGSVLFGDKYKEVPDAIMRKAAERGTFIHNACQMLHDGIEIDNVPEVESWKQIMKSNQLLVAETEFLVSDELRVATKLDYLLDDNSIVEQKTTYILDEEYVSWQLSIAAYLFELQTGIKPPHLYVLWTRGFESKFAEIERKSNDQVKQVIDAYFNNEQLPELLNKHDIPRSVLEIENLIYENEVRIKELKEKQDEYKALLLEQMSTREAKKWETPHLNITKKEATTRKSFDSARFKKENPEQFNLYQKESKVKESILITIRK